jgi:hypothetical protein
MKTLVEGNLEECGRHPLGRPTHAHVGVYGEVQDGGGEVDGWHVWNWWRSQKSMSSLSPSSPIALSVHVNRVANMLGNKDIDFWDLQQFHTWQSSRWCESLELNCFTLATFESFREAMHRWTMKMGRVAGGWLITNFHTSKMINLISLILFKIKLTYKAMLYF